MRGGQTLFKGVFEDTLRAGAGARGMGAGVTRRGPHRKMGWVSNHSAYLIPFCIFVKTIYYEEDEY